MRSTKSRNKRIKNEEVAPHAPRAAAGGAAR